MKIQLTLVICRYEDRGFDYHLLISIIDKFAVFGWMNLAIIHQEWYLHGFGICSTFFKGEGGVGQVAKDACDFMGKNFKFDSY